MASTESSTSNPAPISHPPASNPGSDDPTGGISKDAGGVSSTAGIESPVPAEQKTLTGTVLGYLGLGGKEEKTAEGTDAQSSSASSVPAASTEAPTSSTATSAETTPTSSTVTDSHTPSASVQHDDPAKANNQNYLGQAATGVTAAGTAAAGYVTGKDTSAQSTKTGGTSVEGTESKSATDGVTDSTSSTTDTAGSTVKEAVAGDTSSAEKDTEAPEVEEKKKVSDHQAAVRENKDSIPTAGGQKLGQEHWGESKTIPENPKKQEESSKVSSQEGQPDSTTADNTAKNAGSEHKHGLHLPGHKKDDEVEQHQDKTKLVDKLKHKLHLDKSDK